MSENCPYYITPGHRHIIIGSKRCLAREFPMCGGNDICPGGSVEKTAAPEIPDSEPDDGVSWAEMASEVAEPAEVATAEAEPEASAESPAPPSILDDESLETALRRLRNENGFTLRSLGLAAGISPVNVSKWECGKSRPALDSLQKLDSVYGTDLAERFGGGLRGSGQPARLPRQKKSAAAETVPPVATPEPNADRTRPAPSSPVATAPPIGGRDDFIREILYQAARAREDFNAIIHAALEAVKGHADQ